MDLTPEQTVYLNTLGLALCRNGAFAEAVPILEKSLKESNGAHDAFDLFVLAMCHHRLGNVSLAKDCHGRAVRWFRERRNQLSATWVDELTGFQAEAEAVLSGPP